jgi:hypothetical protein
VRAVTFRNAINRLLRAVTGYELRRVPHGKAAGGQGAKVPARSQPAFEAEPKPEPEMKLPH